MMSDLLVEYIGVTCTNRKCGYAGPHRVLSTGRDSTRRTVQVGECGKCGTRVELRLPPR